MAVPREDPAAPDTGGRALRDNGGTAARIPDPEMERAVLFRWHLAPDHRRRDHGLHGAGAGLHHDPPVRELVEEGELQRGRVPDQIGLCRKKTLSKCRERCRRTCPTRPSGSSLKTAM